jgi:hypothetical protein
MTKRYLEESFIKVSSIPSINLIGLDSISLPNSIISDTVSSGILFLESAIAASIKDKVKGLIP